MNRISNNFFVQCVQTFVVYFVGLGTIPYICLMFFWAVFSDHNPLELIQAVMVLARTLAIIVALLLPMGVSSYRESLKRGSINVGEKLFDHKRKSSGYTLTSED